jgi:hypothetical protein
VSKVDNNTRFIPGGSMEPRLNPRISDDTLNAKLGPSLPRPVVRETSGNPLRVGNDSARRRSVGLPERFNRG